MFGRDHKRIIIFILIGILYLFALTPDLTLGGDDAFYVILARSILSGTGYTNILSPSPDPHANWPPFFPAMLCPLIFFFGENILALKLLSLFCTFGAIYVLYRIFSKYIKGDYLWVVLIFALNPLTLSFSVNVLSEAPFLLFSFLSLLWLWKYQANPITWNKYLWLTLAAMLIAFYTRTIGTALFPAAFFFLLLKRDIKKAFLLAVLCIVGVLPWLLRGYFVGSFYAAHILASDLVTQFFKNLVYYGGKVIGNTLFYPFLSGISREHGLFVLRCVFSAVLSILIFLGFIKRIRKKPTPISLYTMFFFLMLLIWREHDTRLLFPVLPFLIFFLVQGLGIVTRGKKAVTVFLVFVILLSSIAGDAKIIYASRYQPYTPEEQSYLEALYWIRGNTPPEAIIMCRKPSVTFYETGRKAMFFPQTYDTEMFVKEIKESKVDYVIFDALGQKWKKYRMWQAKEYLEPVIKKYPKAFVSEYRTNVPATSVYKVNKRRLLQY